jgi:L-aspartate oxidase
MTDIHPDAELAPRDVVARAIWTLRQKGSDVWLDATALDRLSSRFPTISALAAEAGFDPRSDPLPVSPAAHYHMGGIAVDDRGQAAPGLFAVGEAASTGLHGANRLASNSLIEALVLGARTGDAVSELRPGQPARLEAPDSPRLTEADPATIRTLRATMWEHVGLVRSADGLRTALARFDGIAAQLEQSVTGRNLLTVARTVARAALARTESRGAHHRIDYPQPDPSWARSTLVHPAPVPAIELEAPLDRDAA